MHVLLEWVLLKDVEAKAGWACCLAWLSKKPRQLTHCGLDALLQACKLLGTHALVDLQQHKYENAC
jgi:hypothetical protein